HGDLHALWINPNDKNYMVLGTDGGAYISNDRGNTWKAFQNLPLSQCYRVHVDMESPYRVYIGLQDNGTWYAPSRSANGINNKDWKPIGFGDGFHLVRDPADKENIYWQLQGGLFFRYNEVTGDHQAITPQPGQGEPKLRFNWNAGFAVSPNRFGAIYCGAQYLYRSLDKGVSWSTLSSDLTTNDPRKLRQEESGGITIDNSTAENHCTIFSISESPRDSMIIWVGTDDGNVQVTADDGKTWTNTTPKIAKVPKGALCSSVQGSPHDRSTAFVTFSNHQSGDMKPYLFKTTDMGKTWTSLASDSIEGYAWIIQQDHINPDLLFLGTEFGLWVSVDGGRQWARFTGNMPKVSVRDIVIHPREPDVIVATHGRGVFILDDITPLRHLTAQVIESDAAMLPSRPATTAFIGFEQGWRGDDEYTGGNPEDVAAITYYLKKRHMFGDLKVEVYDSTGKQMASLPAGKRRGINRVFWYLREKPPKVAPSANMDNFMIGPLAPLGIYTVKLVRPSDTLRSTVSVVLDPNSRHSEADRTLQDKSIRELYAMQNDLAYVADAVTQIRDTARVRAKELGAKDALAKSLNTYADRIDSLHKTLVATKEGWLTGEEQLREKVVDLYGMLMFYSGRPTESQLKRLAVLKGDLGKAQQSFEILAGAELTGLNEKLASKNLSPVARIT
ncbi:MAG: glycosyl hydrolase, partial [candidate division Zixibacteria bacterium]|nr:glycosyl hydrolase [candidate division Zixibacteria bacterium]